MPSNLVYDMLQDEKSKEIYKLRALYRKTQDYNYIRQLVYTTDEANQLKKLITTSSYKHVVIWGTGFCGRMIRNTFSDINWTAYIDNTPTSSSLDSLPVIHGDDFLKNPNALVVIGSIKWNTEIENQLLSHDIPNDQIINAGQLLLNLERKQYFDLEKLPLEQEEFFLDAGCYDGNTSINFVNWSRGNAKRILALEPDRTAYNICVEKLTNYAFSSVYNCCAWHENTVLSFDAKGSTSSCITASGNTIISARTIDDIVNNEKISFIKMDIEGAESKAIDGASYTIKKWKPKLAICVYHNLNDYHDIAEQILSLNPNYKFYLRHYSFRDAETVLYAI